MGGLPNWTKKIKPSLGFTSGVQNLLPEEDTRAVRCHVQTILSFGAQPVLPFRIEWPEILFSDRKKTRLIDSQVPSTPDEY